MAQAILAASLLAMGCAKRVETQTPGATESRPVATYYPLAVGNRWTYRVKFLGQEREQQVEILRQQDGVFLDSQGGQLVADAHGVRDQKRYLLRYPVESGRTWSNVVSVSSVEHYRILEAGTRCVVPAGSFEDCVRVEGRNRVDARTTLVNEFTFAQGVGLVRVQVIAEVGAKRIPQTELQLVSYRLGKAAPQR